MKNESEWKPTKLAYKNGKVRPSGDSKELAISSRMTVSQVSDCYNRHLADHCRGRLLDLGCGKAPYYGLYRTLVDDICCVDWQQSVHGNSHIDKHADLTKPLPLEDESFDTILLSSVLEHIPTPMNLWLEMHRVLRRGGKVIMNVPFMYWLHETPHDFYRYTEFALKKMAEDAGFKIVVLESTGGAPVVLVDVLGKMLGGVPFLSAVITQCSYVCMSLFLKTRLGKNLNARTAYTIPNGYFMVVQKHPKIDTSTEKPTDDSNLEPFKDANTNATS